MSTKLSPAEINAVASKIEETLKAKKKEEIALLEKSLKANKFFKRYSSLTKRIAKLEEKRTDAAKLFKEANTNISYLYSSGTIVFNSEVNKIPSIDVIKREVILKNISPVNPETLINELVNELSKK
jgi:hypothetical protein